MNSEICLMHFDRVNHVKLFHILLDRFVDPKFVRLILDWYNKTMHVVKWSNCYSDVCAVKSDIRQGGILSPILFNMYMDVVISDLIIIMIVIWNVCMSDALFMLMT